MTRMVAASREHVLFAFDVLVSELEGGQREVEPPKFENDVW